MKNVDPATYKHLVGRTVTCKEVTERLQLKTLGIDRDFTTVEYDETDPTIVEIKQLRGDGALRIFTPGRSLGTCDYRLDRINVHIHKADDNTYKVTSITAG